MFCFDSISDNEKLVISELDTIQQLVSRIPSADQMTELKGLMSNEQYPVWLVSDKEMNDTLSAEMFDEFFDSHRHTDNILSILRNFHKSNVNTFDLQFNPFNSLTPK